MSVAVINPELILDLILSVLNTTDLIISVKILVHSIAVLKEENKVLCAKSRKGHFEGVLNVVNRFIEIIKPRYIFLGKKDYQQLYLIKKHIQKRKIKSKIIECKTIRENNGIACSSRNLNLSKSQMIIASNVFHYLRSLKKKIKKNYSLFKINKIKKELIKLGVNKIDYLENYNTKSFKKIKKPKKEYNLFFAYYIKKVRLIDNI